MCNITYLGRKRRLGFGRSKVGLGIHRSEEVLPDDLRLAVSQPGSSVSSEDMSGSQDTSDRYKRQEKKTDRHNKS